MCEAFVHGIVPPRDRPCGSGVLARSMGCPDPRTPPWGECECVCARVYECVRVRARACVCESVSVYECECVRACVRVRACVYVCVRVYAWVMSVRV